VNRAYANTAAVKKRLPSAILPIAFLAQFDEPKIDIVNALDILGQQRLVCIVVDGDFTVALFEIVDDVEEFVDLGMHDAEVGNDTYFIDGEGAALGTKWHYSPPRDIRLQCGIWRK
jgi:hypothetical protein